LGSIQAIRSRTFVNPGVFSAQGTQSVAQPVIRDRAPSSVTIPFSTETRTEPRRGALAST
jgi:hypothetical protein